MLNILRYSFFDLMRSRWSYFYFGFYLVLSFALLFLNSSLPKAVITLMNMIIILTPLIGTVFGVMYFYSSREFTELLLAQPVKRSTLFLGQYLGIAGSLSLSLILGLGIPFLIYGVFQSGEILNFLFLLIDGALLTFAFVAIAFIISLYHDNRIKGFGYAILVWLFFAVIYDGLFLVSLLIFEEYPLDTFSLVATMLNPVDLSRILILLKLDISALLGYTGAVFQQFFGTGWGLFLSAASLVAWVVIPMSIMLRMSRKKDF